MRVYELGRRGEVRSEKKMMIECRRERESERRRQQQRTIKGVD